MELTLKIPADEETIRREVKILSDAIDLRLSEIDILSTGVKHYQKQCKHPGQVTGSNERDGSWGNPCPVCGYSY